MRLYVATVAAVAAALVALHFAICLFVPAPISAEYWVREVMIVKERLAARVSGPRVLFLGGSSTLFGVDARQFESELGVRAVNLGLHAGMRLDDILSFGESVARSGDTVVLMLEPPFYRCDALEWTDWQLRNAIAWNRPHFESLSLWERTKAVYSGGVLGLAPEILADKVRSRLQPEKYRERILALDEPERVWQRHGTHPPSKFTYSAEFLDDRGDLNGARRHFFIGKPIYATQPDSICAKVRPVLIAFLARMKSRGIHVVLADTPYVAEVNRSVDWRPAERQFVADAHAIGLTVIDSRQDELFPLDGFYGTSFHLNADGRRVRTSMLAAKVKPFLGLPQATPGNRPEGRE
jgi:hypothetical protein